MDDKLVAPEQEVIQTETQTAQEETIPTHAEKVESSQERNFRMLRESRERAERERDEALRLLQVAQAKELSNEEDVKLAPDELVEWRHVEKKIKRLEDQIKSYHQQTSETTTESRLKAQYADFDRVVSRENVEMLRAAYPEIADTLNSNPDLYTKAVAAYTMIKKLGIDEQDPYAADKQRAQQNAAKPRPLASVGPQQGDSPLSNANAFANGLTEDLKKQLLKEMIEAAKNR